MIVRIAAENQLARIAQKLPASGGVFQHHLHVPLPDFPAMPNIVIRERESAASVNGMFRRFIKRLNVASAPSAYRDKTRLG
jgi:hypothetical protein